MENLVNQHSCGRNTRKMVMPGFGEIKVKGIVNRMADATAGAGLKAKETENAQRSLRFGRGPKEQQQQGRGPKHRFQVFMMKVSKHFKQNNAKILI